jgi:4-hydroxy-tetrahydrodipicolinate synthase
MIYDPMRDKHMIRIYTALITPFQVNGEIDYPIMEDLITWQAQAGIDGLLICGTNGEFTSLSFEEVKSLLQFAGDRKKEGLEIIAGTGRASLKETVALCNFAEGIADKALVVPPFYFKPLDPIGLYTYFKQLLEQTRIPIILYHIPKYTGISITNELLLKLKGYRNLLGVKDSSGRLEDTESFLNQCPNLSIYAGSDALLYASFEKGAIGAISSISNIFPREVLEIKKQFAAGNHVSAQVAQEDVLKIRRIMKEFPDRGAVKYVLSLLGHSFSYVRPPLVDLHEKARTDLKIKLNPFLKLK